MDQKINIVFFGPSGVNKKLAAETFGKVCATQFPACRIQRLDVTNFLNTSTHVLLHSSAWIQKEIVSDAIEKGICPQLSNAELNIINLHAAHLCAGIQVFPCIAKSIEAIKPDIFVTLLDDIFNCKTRLERDGYPFSFSQLLTWRQIECGMVDHLAQVLDIDNIYLAAKHPRITLYRLIFDPQKPRIYSASQITKARESLGAIDEIEKHRRILHQKYVAFDPLTLDDRLIINKIPDNTNGDEIFEITQDKRWPCDFSDLGEEYKSLVVQDESFFPLKIEVQTAMNLNKPIEKNSRRNIIDVQIRHRDLRYIDQADVVSAYRPIWDGHESSGVDAEKIYAAGSGRTPVVEYSLPSDIEKLGSKVFNTPLAGPLCTELNEFYTQLNTVAVKEALKRYRRNKKKYAKFESFRNRWVGGQRAAGL